MDVMKKVEKAINTPGACYIQVHTPCSTGWGFDGAKTIEIGKQAIECGLWVNYEMENGELKKAKKILRTPVDDYLKAQKRFRHLFKPERNAEEIAKIQAIADANAAKYNIDIKLKE